MPKHKTFPVIPGAETPEGVARIEKLSKARDEIDYEAYMLLRCLHDGGYLRRDALEALAVRGDMDLEEAEAYAEQVEEIIKRRRATEHELLNALAGR